MNKVTKLRHCPAHTRVLDGLDRFDYSDTYSIACHGNATVRQITRKLMEMPAWGKALMKIRDLIVKPFGLVTANTLRRDKSAPPYEFMLAPVLFSSNHELILAMDDKHLYYRLSVLKDGHRVYMTTVVRFNNRGGRIYFAVIKPFHRFIVRTTLKRLNRTDWLRAPQDMPRHKI
ncbi:MAG: DUF2867 domain-containing protein [Breznakibacter sp.]